MNQLPKNLKKLWGEAQRRHQTVGPSEVRATSYRKNPYIEKLLPRTNKGHQPLSTRTHNDEIAKVLDEIGDTLELSGENFFRVRAYRNAALAIHDQPVLAAELTVEQVDAIPGIGADLAGKDHDA